MTGDDWADDPRAKRWIAGVRRDLVPMIEGSAYVMSLVPDSDQLDIKFSVELGVAIMLDKPIIAVVIDNRTVPPKLARVCDAVIEWTDDKAEMMRRIEAVTSGRSR